MESFEITPTKKRSCCIVEYFSWEFPSIRQALVRILVGLASRI